MTPTVITRRHPTTTTTNNVQFNDTPATTVIHESYYYDNQNIAHRMADDAGAVSLRPDLRGGNVCGVDGAPERVPDGEPALPHVLGSDDGRIRGGYLQVQYRVRGLAEAAAASHAAADESAGLEEDTDDGGDAAALVGALRSLELVEGYGEEEQLLEEVEEEEDDLTVDADPEDNDERVKKEERSEAWRRDYDDVD